MKRNSEKHNHLHNNFVLITILLFAYISLSFGQLATWQLGGYAKDLLTYADGQVEELPFEYGLWQNTGQVRLNLFWYPLESIKITVQARNLLIYQKNNRQLRTFQDQLNPNSYFFDLKYNWLEEDDWYGFSEIDRLSLDWNSNDLELILGRQRIAWGTCLVWNPTDFFNPFDILDFDYEERPGTDAAHLQYYTGPLSQFNLAVTPGRTRNEVIYAGRYMTNNWNYDFNFIAGWQHNSLKLAVSWAGEIYDGGFRGELLYSDPDITYTTFNLTATSVADLFKTVKIKNPYWTMALSYDYTFKNSLYIHTEYIYNGLGTTENAGSRRFDVIYTSELTPARHSVFQEFAYQITPLLRGDFFIIFNPNDKSWIAAPSVQYSVATNWEVYLLAFPSGGEVGTEYGGFPSQYFARIKYSF